MPERALGIGGRVVAPEGVYTALVSQAGGQGGLLLAPCPLPTE
jgi:hypothetical protein